MFNLPFNRAKGPFLIPNGQIIAEEFNLLALSEKQISDQIYTTHDLSDETYDDDSLFIIVENLIKRATQYVDKKVQGIQVHVDDVIEDKTPKANFNVPLCTLKGILCGMQCKSPGDKIAHDAAVAILKKLSKFSWEAKASLTLAAFAMEYGEFWLLAQHRESDPLAKSIAVLKRVLKSSEVAKRSQSIIELNNLIKVTLRVIECIDKLNKYSNFNYDSVVIRDLSKALLDLIPVDVYWVIITVVACATKMTILTRDENMEYNLANYSEKMNYILQNLTTHLRIFKIESEVEKTYRWIVTLFRQRAEITVLFKGLIFPKDTVESVDINIIKEMNVLLFISRLDIMAVDIEILQGIHEFITKNHDKRMIVWIPIVEEWTDDLIKEFHIMKQKMPWLTVQLSGHIAGIKYIKTDWNFKGEPMMVVMNPKGIVEHFDALHMIRVWGVLQAFPYTKEKETELLTGQGRDWICSVLEGTRHPDLPTWIEGGRYIIFYGGRDNLWIQEFEEKAHALIKSPIFKDEKIQLEFVYVGKARKREDDYGLLHLFWTGVESRFVMESQTESVTKDIHKLLSYKNESGWALLSKGPTAVVICHGEPVLKVVEDSEMWKETLKDGGAFGSTFEQYYKEITSNQENLPCCRLDIPRTGKVPELMKCPDCHSRMETFISFRCCHKATTTSTLEPSSSLRMPIFIFFGMLLAIGLSWLNS